jgi:hypothetical protein
MASLLVAVQCSVEDLKALLNDLHDFISSCEESSITEGVLQLSNVELSISLTRCDEAPSPKTEQSTLESAMEEAFTKSCFDTAKQELEQVFRKTQTAPLTDNFESQFTDFYTFKDRLLNSAKHSRRNSSVLFEPDDSSTANDFLADELTRLAKLKHKLETNYMNSEKLVLELTAERSKVALDKKLLLDLRAELIEAMACRED